MENGHGKKPVSPRHCEHNTPPRYSPYAKLAYLVELIVAWKEGVEEAFERKKTKYSELATEATMDRKNKKTKKYFSVEVGCMGFVATSTSSL